MEFFGISDDTGLDDFDGATEAIGCGSLVAHLGREFLFAGEVAHEAGFPNGLSEGFLAVDVLAHLHRHDGGNAMKVVGGGDGDRVDFVSDGAEHFAEVRVL